jgi:hypothetical protein
MRVMFRPGALLSAFVGGILSLFGGPAFGAEALAFANGPASGVAFLQEGGTGWSFVPVTNLTVTSVGYLDLANTGGDPNAVVTIWATNAVIASYTDITDGAARYGEVVSKPIPPLGLSAGEAYSITVHTSPLAASTWYGALHDNAGAVQYDPFVVAPELSHYWACQLNQDGTFGPPPSDPGLYPQLLWLGPTFTYQIGSAPPVLTIALTNNNSVVLRWPTNAAGYVLQGSLAVTGTYANLTNAPSVDGVSYLTVVPRASAGTFFRLKKAS